MVDPYLLHMGILEWQWGARATPWEWEAHIGHLGTTTLSPFIQMITGRDTPINLLDIIDLPPLE